MRHANDQTHGDSVVTDRNAEVLAVLGLYVVLTVVVPEVVWFVVEVMR